MSDQFTRTSGRALATLLHRRGRSSHSDDVPCRRWLARKPVTIVVPFPAGGGTDALPAPLTATLSKNTGKQFIIDNRGGGAAP